MKFTATCFSGVTPLTKETVGSFAAARDIARTRLAVHRIRSGATYVEVRTDHDVVMFDSRDGVGPACGRRPTLAAQLIKRLSIPNSSPA